MRPRPIITILTAWLLGVLPTMAEGAGHDHLPNYAEEIFRIPIPGLGPFIVTNSMLMVWIVAAVLIVVAQLATRDMKLIPERPAELRRVAGREPLRLPRGHPRQAPGEADLLVLRHHLHPDPVHQLVRPDPRASARSAAWTPRGFGGDPHDTFRPFLRGANADLNMTAAMAFTFAILWFYWAITENGLKGFLAHIFAPKGKFDGIMQVLMIAVFLFVGVIEVISIVIRPVALTFRLYGNIYAGENMLENMMADRRDKTWLAWLPPLPFYFMELLVGFIQALVFMLLTAVFLKLICDHGDDDHARITDH